MDELINGSDLVVRHGQDLYIKAASAGIPSPGMLELIEMQAKLTPAEWVRHLEELARVDGALVTVLTSTVTD